ncbi:MAG: hypothetical protein AAF681_09400 [Pseudomonadota bacterium]
MSIWTKKKGGVAFVRRAPEILALSGLAIGSGWLGLLDRVWRSVHAGAGCKRRDWDAWLPSQAGHRIFALRGGEAVLADQRYPEPPPGARTHLAVV